MTTEETHISGAVVFKGQFSVFEDVIRFIESNGGRVIYKRFTSPDRKLFIREGN